MQGPVSGNQVIQRLYAEQYSAVADGQAIAAAPNYIQLNYPALFNTISGATLASNGNGQITLPAGTYSVNCVLAVYQGNNTVLFLYNVTDAAQIVATPIVGITADGQIQLVTQFTLAAQKTIAIGCNTSRTGNTFGRRSLSLKTVFCSINLTKDS